MFSDGIVYPRRRSCILGEDRVSSDGIVCSRRVITHLRRRSCGAQLTVKLLSKYSSVLLHWSLLTKADLLDCLQKLIFLPLLTKAALMVRTLASVDKSRSCFIWTEIYMTGGALMVPGSVRWGVLMGSGCQYPLRTVDGSNETGSESGHHLKSPSSGRDCACS